MNHNSDQILPLIMYLVMVVAKGAGAVRFTSDFV